MRIPLAPAFDATREVEEDRLRTGPAAPDTAEQCGDVEKAEAETAHDEEGDPDILAEKRQAEVVELAIGDIEEEGRIAIDANPGERHVERSEGDGQKRA